MIPIVPRWRSVMSGPTSTIVTIATPIASEFRSLAMAVHMYHLHFYFPRGSGSFIDSSLCYSWLSAVLIH